MILAGRTRTVQCTARFYSLNLIVVWTRELPSPSSASRRKTDASDYIGRLCTVIYAYCLYYNIITTILTSSVRSISQLRFIHPSHPQPHYFPFYSPPHFYFPCPLPSFPVSTPCAYRPFFQGAGNHLPKKLTVVSKEHKVIT